MADKFKHIIEVEMKGVPQTKNKLKELDAKTKKLGGTTEKASNNNKNLGSSFKSMALKIGASTVAIIAVQKAFKYSIDVGMKFEQAMANVKAISGATSQQFKTLEADAKRLGSSTKFTATEVANLQTEYSKLGFTASEITKVTEGTLALASAVGADLPRSAEVAGATLRGFALDASQTNRVTDVMALSFSSSALDMEKFAESMKFVAPIAKSAGFTIEGTTAIMAKMADVGIHGSLAGTALKNIFIELSKESGALSDRLGGQVTSMEDLAPALEQLKEEGLTLSEAIDLVGKRSAPAFLALVEGAGDLEGLKEAFDNAGGSAQTMADIQLDTLEGKVTIMKSATEGLGIAFYDTFDDALQSGVTMITGMVGGLTELIAIKPEEQFRNQKVEMMGLIGTLKDHNISSQTRLATVKTLNEEYGNLIGFEVTEKTSLEDLEIAQNNIINAMVKRIALGTKEDEIAKIMEVREQTKAFIQDLKEQEAHLVASGNATESIAFGVRSINFENDETKDAWENIQLQLEMANSDLESMPDKVKDLTAEARILAEELGQPFNGESKENIETTIQTWVEFKETLATITSTTLPEFKETYTSVLSNMNEEIGVFYANLEMLDGSNVENKMIRINMQEARQIEQLRNIDESTMSYDEKAKVRDKIKDAFDKKRTQTKIKTKADEFKSYEGIARAFGASEKDIAITKATIDAYVAIQKAWTSAPYPANVVPIAMATAKSWANVANIKAQGFATGGSFTTTGEMPIIVGDNPSGMERIDITPIEEGDAPETSSQNININMSGNILSQDFIEEEAIPAIKEAIRRGADIGIG